MVACEHHQLAENVHQFIFKQASRQAVDEYIAYLEQILPQLGENDPWLSILDMSQSGMIPLRYALKKVTDVSKGHLTNRINRTVVIHDAGPVAQIGHALVNPINNNVRFLTPEKSGEAVPWLIQEKVR